MDTITKYFVQIKHHIADWLTISDPLFSEVEARAKKQFYEEVSPGEDYRLIRNETKTTVLKDI